MRSGYSFRVRLASRVTASMALAMTAVASLSFFGLRRALDQEIDASILNVASIQAASLTDSPDGSMRFHEWELTPAEAVSIRELNRYAQVWDLSGRPLLRTRYITADLPMDLAALERAGGGELVWRAQEFDGVPIRSLFYPLERLGSAHRNHVLQVSAPLVGRDRTLRVTGFLLGLIVMTVVGGTWLGSRWLAGSAVRPVGVIIDQAEAIEAGTLDRRIDAFAETTEYQRLVQVLNTMLERIDRSFQSQKRFTPDAGHELRGPLTVLRGELEVALRRPRGNEEYKEVLESGLEEVERLTRVTEDLLTLARSDEGAIVARREDALLDEEAHALLGRLSQTASEGGVTLERDIRGPVRIPHDRDLMSRLIWNLLQNAVEHTPEGGTVRLHVAPTPGGAVLEVHDTGPGFPPEEVDRVFERFYRADEARSSGRDGRYSTGLGLSIVKAIAAAHGGTAVAGRSPLGGAVVRVEIPG